MYLKNTLVAVLAALVITIVTGPGVSAQLADGEMSSRPVPSFDKPVNPDLYLVRPGEHLKVTFINSKLSPFELEVDAEGRVVDPKIGVHDLSGLTLTQTRELLMEPLSRLYNADDIMISINRIYPVTIRVTGAVRNPGRYIGYTSQTVSELIDSAGGILPGGSTRYVKFSGGPKLLRVDLDRADHLGDMNADPCLYAGTTIEVPTRHQGSVQIVGEVKAPCDVEWVEGDDFSVLLALAGGPTTSADTKHPLILNDTQRNPLNAGQIKPGDVINVPVDETNTGGSALTVVGAVNKPGRYALKSGMSVADLMSEAGGMTSRANAERITIFRRVPSGVKSGQMNGRYPIYAGTSGRTDAAPLWPGDSIYVPVQVGFVRVTGAVARPGMYPYLAGSSALEYIKLAGGFVAQAKQSQIEMLDRISGLTRTVGTSAVVADGDEINVLSDEVPK